MFGDLPLSTAYLVVCVVKRRVEACAPRHAELCFAVTVCRQKRGEDETKQSERRTASADQTKSSTRDPPVWTNLQDTSSAAEAGPITEGLKHKGRSKSAQKVPGETLLGYSAAAFTVCTLHHGDVRT